MLFIKLNLYSAHRCVFKGHERVSLKFKFYAKPSYLVDVEMRYWHSLTIHNHVLARTYTLTFKTPSLKHLFNNLY